MEDDAKLSYRGKPLSVRALHLLQNYKKSFAWIAFVPLFVYCVALLEPSTFKDFNWESYVTIALTNIALVLMMNNQPPDLVMVGVNIILLLCQIVTTDEALAGLSSASILAIAILFVVAKAMEETGVIERILVSVLGRPSSAGVAILRMAFPVAIVSAFMNNTPVVAMMIPVVESWSLRTGIPASKLLMPLSFASMLGGMCTLLGTSTNLILKNLADGDDSYDDDDGDDDNNETFTINMFTMTSVGAPLMVVGIIFMSLFSGFLPQHQALGANASRVMYYVARFVCTEDAEGSTPQSIGLMSTRGTKLLSLAPTEARQPTLSVSHCEASSTSLLASTSSPPISGVLPPPKHGQQPPSSGEDLAEQDLREGDVLEFACTGDGIAKLRRNRELVLQCEQEVVSLLGPGRRHRRLFEVVVDDACVLVGQQFNQGTQVSAVTAYHAYIIAHRRANRATISTLRHSRYTQRPRSEGEIQRTLIDDSLSVGGDTPTIEAGDMLVVESHDSFVKSHTNTGHFSVIRELEKSLTPRHVTFMDRVRMYTAGLILIVMVGLASANRPGLSIFTLSLAASMLLIVFQCITVEQAFAAINGRVILAIIATYGLGSALQDTGVAELLARGLVSIGKQVGPIGLLCMLFLCVAILSCVVSNQATVILLWPVVRKIDIHGLKLAHYAIILMMGASTAFATPIGYQTNLMVYGPGQYTFGDFLRFGAPLTLVLTVVAGFLTYYLF